MNIYKYNLKCPVILNTYRTRCTQRKEIILNKTL